MKKEILIVNNVKQRTIACVKCANQLLLKFTLLILWPRLFLSRIVLFLFSPSMPRTSVNLKISTSKVWTLLAIPYFNLPLLTTIQIFPILIMMITIVSYSESLGMPKRLLQRSTYSPRLLKTSTFLKLPSWSEQFWVISWHTSNKQNKIIKKKRLHNPI